jgi:hypothetical protein
MKESKDPIRFALLPRFNERINWLDIFLYAGAYLPVVICWSIAGISYLMS